MRPQSVLLPVTGLVLFPLMIGTAQAAVCNVPDAMHTTIQSAADDVNCTEIILGAQVFTEQVTVGRVGSIYIHGAGAGRTILRSPAIRNPSTQPTTYYPNYTYIVEVKPGTAADLADLTIDGTGNSFCGEPLFGVRFNNANGSLDRVVVDHVRSPGAAIGCQNTISVGVTADGGGSASVTVAHSTVRDFQKVGVLVNGANAGAVLVNNIIRGVGKSPYIAQNGIQFSRGAFGSAQQNRISAIHYSGDVCVAGVSVGSGILSYQAAATTFLTQNTIIDVDSAITLQECTGSQVVFQNRVYSSQLGISSKSNAAGVVRISDNSVTGSVISDAVNAAMCFPESGDGIVVDAESGTQVVSNSIADAARDGYEFQSMSQALDVEQNKATRSARQDIEDLGTGNVFSLNLCKSSAPAGLCVGTP